MRHFCFSLIALVLLASCTSETFNTDSDNEFISHVTITANDFETDDVTRTSLELTSSGLSFTWAENDVVGIYPNAGDQVSFPMTSGAGTKKADFDGGGWALKGNYTYSAYYPYSVDNTTYGRPYTALPISYLGQKQPANNSTAGLGAYDYMVATASAPESGNVTFNFSHIGSVLYIQLTTPKAETFTKLTLSADEAIFTTEATVNISNATLTPTSTATDMALELENIDIAAGGTLNAWIMIAPVNAKNNTLTIIATTSNEENYTEELAGKDYQAGKAYRMAGTLDLFGAGGTGDDFDWGDDNEMESHAYIDLGLTSGTLWATCNIGAASPEEYGYYFAWGETAPKENYDWSTYKFGNTSNFTKYNSTDGLTQLKLEDDAAYIIWGKNWRMPTHEEELELTRECSWENDVINNISGYKITGPNGNTIFMPRGGLYDGTDYGSNGQELSFVNTDGWYWSSTLNYTGSSYAQGLCFFPSLIESVSDHERCDGHNIRPVYIQKSEDENNNAKEYEYVDLGLPSGTLWATLNIGANNPEEYGQYFAWGELEEKTDYSTQAYLYYSGTYENIGTDIANTEYDVAKHLWGNGWHMPTYNQFQELMKNCSWTRTTQNNIKGYLVQGNNNSIFLPCGGFKNGSGDNYIGTMAYYWSSTSNGSTAYCVWDGPKWYCNYRRDGMPIRPVRNQ